MTAPRPAGHRALGTCVPKIWSACREEGRGFEWSVWTVSLPGISAWRAVNKETVFYGTQPMFD